MPKQILNLKKKLKHVREKQCFRIYNNVKKKQNTDTIVNKLS